MRKPYLAAYRTAYGMHDVPGRYSNLNAAHAAARRAAQRRGIHPLNFETVAARAATPLEIAAIIVAAVAIALPFGMAAMAPEHECRIEAIDSAGNLYVAGAGDTLPDAWRNAVMSADWTEVRTVCE